MEPFSCTEFFPIFFSNAMIGLQLFKIMFIHLFAKPLQAMLYNGIFFPHLQLTTIPLPAFKNIYLLAYIYDAMLQRAIWV